MAPITIVEVRPCNKTCLDRFPKLGNDLLLTEGQEEVMTRVHRLLGSNKRSAGHNDDVVSQIVDNIVAKQVVLLRSFRKLRQDYWLKDEVINYFIALLRQRDATLQERGLIPTRSHFFPTWFYTQLLEAVGVSQSIGKGQARDDGVTTADPIDLLSDGEDNGQLCAQGSISFTGRPTANAVSKSDQVSRYSRFAPTGKLLPSLCLGFIFLGVGHPPNKEFVFPAQ